MSKINKIKCFINTTTKTSKLKITFRLCSLLSRIVFHWNFIKIETSAQVFSCEFYEHFWEHLFHRTLPSNCFYCYYLKHLTFEFFFLSCNCPSIYSLILVNFANAFVILIIAIIFWVLDSLHLCLFIKVVAPFVFFFETIL